MGLRRRFWPDLSSPPQKELLKHKECWRLAPKSQSPINVLIRLKKHRSNARLQEKVTSSADKMWAKGHSLNIFPCSQKEGVRGVNGAPAGRGEQDVPALTAMVGPAQGPKLDFLCQASRNEDRPRTEPLTEVKWWDVYFTCFRFCLQYKTWCAS